MTRPEDSDFADNSELYEEGEPVGKNEEDYGLNASSPTDREGWERKVLTDGSGATAPAEGTSVYDPRELLEEAWAFYRQNPDLERVHLDEPEEIDEDYGMTARDARVFLSEKFKNSYTVIPEIWFPESENNYDLEDLLEDSSAENMNDFLDEGAGTYLEKTEESINMGSSEHEISFYKPIHD